MKEIGSHPFCKEIKLTHLSFADDIMVFMDGTLGSLYNIMIVVDEYAHISVFNINVSKSTIFDAGRGKMTLEIEATSVGLVVSSLPIWYLGLRLTTKAMTRLDYKPLLDKIRSRFLIGQASTSHLRLSTTYELSYMKHLKFLVFSLQASKNCF